MAVATTAAADMRARLEQVVRRRGLRTHVLHLAELLAEPDRASG